MTMVHDQEDAMVDYVDIFVVPVPEKNIEAYRKQSELW